MVARKKLIGLGVVVVLAVIGVVIGVIVSRKSSGSTSTGAGNLSSSTSSSGNSNSDTSTRSDSTTSSSGNGKVSASSALGLSSGGTAITSDPTSVTYSLAAFAIGDWGSTVQPDSCCTRSSTYADYDIVAEDVVASIMNTQAGDADVAPKAIISHGDNFYWDGIMGSSDKDTRFTSTFEEKYDGDNIKTVPWVNVLGNHDYGGADYICTDGSNPTKCSSTSELLEFLDKKFSWQATYTSPNDDRWVLKDHFYVYSMEDSASGVSIDVFNVDAGDADTHGALQVCCQCYGYSKGDDDSCNNIARGDKYCAGGDTGMFDQCSAVFANWSDSSRTQLKEKLASSTATWKIVNSHYSPYAHYAEAGMTKWFDILNGSDVHLWLNGHTHGENHDYSSSLGVHFVDNGAGGGIQMESASGIPTYAEDYVSNLWTYGGNEYGFFSLTASKDWLKLQYHTADASWSYGSTLGETTAGGVETKHCWYIPNDGTEGKECSSKSS